MEPPPTDDPLQALLADEVTRADGRYLIYYAWPPDADEPMPLGDNDRQGDAGDDV